MRKSIRILAVITFICSFILFVTISILNFSIPDKFYVIKGNELKINSIFNITSSYNKNNHISLASANVGSNYTTELKLFNKIPIKQTRVEVIDETYLMPCGTPFGIKMFTEGVLVVGMSDILTEKGNINPAKTAGIQLGDVILKINDIPVNTNEQVSEIISGSSGQSLVLDVKRKDVEFKINFTPVISKSDGGYKAGIWVRDSSAGIGTVTFYNPNNSTFGGLGHGVSDIDTGEIMPLMSGEVVDANISSIKKGQAGIAGELRGSFSSNQATGEILMNNETGVFGYMYKKPNVNKLLPIALKQEIKNGPAKIISTIEGNLPKEYDIEIEKINLNGLSQTKNMIVKIIDSELLEKTGGIVQGMSGSPIIQGDKIIGAITHVFIKDPTKGYGIFVENMYNSSQNIIVSRNENVS